ncbi:hypothetical protein ASPCADRAFT_6359 [Aspergillus carbonarius ITEM 5010]|uniref:VIT domain-containing protein n=1 Tax=Aspergillus carbonarius (strain ITEM 5010) TaxID=602072 RepID=A0A1R3RJK9_ASPC5|nr:hypothetical protein ASPCADRAFT_6359 [Aspergillus carbonarius ITEM 5010]
MDAIDQFQSGLFVRYVEPCSNIGVRPTAYRPATPESPSKLAQSLQREQQLPNKGTENGEEVPPPLLSVSVDVDIQGRFSTTKITQCFTNTSPSAARDAHYLFPLYDGSVITSIRCWLGDRLLEGAVKPKEVAQEYIIWLQGL